MAESLVSCFLTHSVVVVIAVFSFIMTLSNATYAAKVSDTIQYTYKNIRL